MAGEFFPDLTRTRQFLQDFAVGWGAPRLIAPMVAPVVHRGTGEDSMSGKFPIWGREEFMMESDKFGRAGTPTEVHRTTRSANYDCNIFGLKEHIAPMDRSQADAELAWYYSGEKAIRALKRKIQIRWESEVASMLATSGNYASGLYEDMDSASNRNFDDSSGPGALALLLEFRDTVEAKCGEMPDTLILAADTARLLLTDSNFFGGGSTNVKLSLDDLRELLEVEQVLIGRGLHVNDTPKRDNDYTFSRLWTSNGAWFTISPKSVDKESPASIKTFTADPDDSFTRGEKVSVFFDEENGATGMFEYRYQHCRDVKACGIDTSNDFVSAAYMANCYASI